MKIHTVIAAIIPVLLACSVAYATPVSPSKLAYLKDGCLWAVPIKSDGRPSRTATGQRVCKLWPSGDDEGVSLFGAPHGGYIAVEHWVRLEDGAKTRYGLVPGSTYNRIHVMTLGDQPHEVAEVDGSDPSFAPDGKYLAFADGAGVRILDIAHNKTRLLRKNVGDQFWSDNGKEIAVIDDSDPDNDGDGSALVLNAATGTEKYRTVAGVNPSDPILSPNGRYVAVLFHLSRPKLGHEIFDRWSSKPFNQDYDKPGYWPGVLEEWSSNGKWLLWDWRKKDPENDGSWLWDEVGLVRFDAKFKRTLGRGIDPTFTPDSRHLLWLSERNRGDEAPHDIMWSSYSGRRKARLVANVDDFSVVQY